ncbi:MoaB/Mog domain-containing protein [Auriculariales sp. MPI-PUGE-AT-0066]|nr:MoaB/Mog domain-containing protein [Auriculariales sp. MPI-PUGE-AT-0066]
MFAVLVISDRASHDAAFDKSGPAIRNELEATTSLHCFGVEIVPDDISAIRSAVRRFCDDPSIDLLLTSGGTGFGQRDNTPEAVKPLLEREASGLVHLLLSSSLLNTPMAALSRPVAGTIGKSLVVTLPGSAKAVKECVAALVAGGTGENIHERMAHPPAHRPNTTHSHSHHHHHHHRHHTEHVEEMQTPTSHLSLALRQRVSPFPQIAFDEAVAILLRTVPTLSSVTSKVGNNLWGHILAEDVISSQDIPATMTTNVDGYAMQCPLHLAGSYRPNPHRGHIPHQHGRSLPAGCDAVIMVEDTELASSRPSTASTGADEAEVKTMKAVGKHENVRMPGTDVRTGDLVLPKGTLVTATGGEVGAIAFVGKREVLVHKKPTVALLSTGNELADIQGQGGNVTAIEAWSGIWDTNRPTLHTALVGLGYQVIDMGIVPDAFAEHRDTLQKALERADILITTGGSSMGSSDLLKPVIEDLGGIIHFGRVSVKPGKPTAFATIPVASAATPKVVFALPGNPASAIVCFNLFVVPALRKMGGQDPKKCQLPRVQVQLQEDMRLDSRPEFHRVVIRCAQNGVLKAYSTGGQRSSRALSFAGANGLVALPALHEGGPGVLKQNELCEAVVIGELEMEI